MTIYHHSELVIHSTKNAQIVYQNDKLDIRSCNVKFHVLEIGIIQYSLICGLDRNHMDPNLTRFHFILTVIIRLVIDFTTLLPSNNCKPTFNVDMCYHCINCIAETIVHKSVIKLIQFDRRGDRILEVKY